MLQPNDEQAQKYDQRFSAIERGDTSGRVTDLMGTPTTVRRGEDVSLTTMAWNTSGYGQGNPCDMEYVYHIPWSPFHADWVIGFDKQERVVAKYHGD